MAHYLYFHKSGDLDLALHPIFKKKSSALSRVHKTSSAKKIRTIGPSVRPVEPLKTDRQTNRQTDRQTHTDRGDQYTLRKVFRKVIRGAIIGYFSYYIDFNWPWPLTFDLWPLTLTLIYFVRKNVMLWRRVTQNGASHIQMEITLR